MVCWERTSCRWHRMIWDSRQAVFWREWFSIQYKVVQDWRNWNACVLSKWQDYNYILWWPCLQGRQSWCIFDYGSIGSFDFTDVKRSTYAELMSSFTRPGHRNLLSFFDYEHSKHPTVATICSNRRGSDYSLQRPFQTSTVAARVWRQQDCQSF